MPKARVIRSGGAKVPPYFKMKRFKKLFLFFMCILPFAVFIATSSEIGEVYVTFYWSLFRSGIYSFLAGVFS